MVAPGRDCIVVVLTPVTCLTIGSDRVVKGLLAAMKKLNFIISFCSFSANKIISIENRDLNFLYNNQTLNQHALKLVVD